MASRAADLLEQTPYPSPPSPPQLDPDAALRIARSMRAAEAWAHQLAQIDPETIKQKQVAFLRRFSETVGTLRGIAVKQTAHVELIDEERKFLQDIVQIVQVGGSGGGRKYSGWYPGLFYAGPKRCAKADALVADVHTNPPSLVPPDPGCVLQQGVGGVDLLIVVVETGEDRTVFAGPTLSHYEFEMPGMTRKSDSEWNAELDARHFPARPVWTEAYLVASDQIPSPPLVPNVRANIHKATESARAELGS